MAGVWAAAAAHCLPPGASLAQWKQSDDGARAALAAVGLVLVPGSVQAPPTQRQGKNLSHSYRLVEVWRGGERSPPTPLKNLLSAKSRVLTEAERRAIAEEVSGKMKARITQGPGAVHDAAISAFLDAVDPQKTLQVQALAVQPSVRHALAVRGAKDGDAAWLGLKVKAAAARTGTGQVND